MENKVEEYRKQFQPETLELIVKICWCREKGGRINFDMDMLDDNHMAAAHIDQALDVKSGELLDVGASVIKTGAF